ncbi:MAG: class I SAM-dependent rRNA methyltransferase [Flavobacteriales bacterium]|nr:class I SAM-dependent rRNA methyltransferase [Flavobacteriales bacterium]
MPQARIIIDDRNDRVRLGHPWIFGTQVLKEEGAYVPGDVVQVLDAKRRALGQGYINPASMIRVRLLTSDPADRVSKAFITARLKRAVAFRQGRGLRPDGRGGWEGSCRLVFGESDLLPGLVVDRFQDVERGETALVAQFLTLGMERWRDVVIEVLQEEVRPAVLVLRNDVPIREKEGLPLEKGFAGKAGRTDLVIAEGDGGVRTHVDLMGGQKTGHFLDQTLNHAAMALVGPGRRVLDCFTHTGGFALHAAKHGATEVLGLDISAEAVAMAARNAALNGFQRTTFREANVFDHLAAMDRRGERWDTIVLDPPAFAKSKGALENAYRGYKEINLRAMKCLPSGGFLVTCSCSQHMTPELFRQVLADAALDAGRRLRELYSGSQPPDHPILWGLPETHYLKCLILEVL